MKETQPDSLPNAAERAHARRAVGVRAGLGVLSLVAAGAYSFWPRDVILFPFTDARRYPYWSSATLHADGQTLLFGTTDGRILTVDIAERVAASEGQLDD